MSCNKSQSVLEVLPLFPSLCTLCVCAQFFLLLHTTLKLFNGFSRAFTFNSQIHVIFFRFFFSHFVQFVWMQNVLVPSSHRTWIPSLTLMLVVMWISCLLLRVLMCVFCFFHFFSNFFLRYEIQHIKKADKPRTHTHTEKSF